MTVTTDEKLNSATIYQVAYENNILASVTIELVTKCNWRCSHCYIPSHTNRGMSKEKLFSLFEELKKMGTMDLVLTGGEIFSRKDTLEIIKKAREMHFSVTLLSNASLLNEDIIKELSLLYISEFSCTVFSLEDEIHDSITSIKGSLKKTLANIELLKKYEIPLQVKTPLMSSNKFAYQELQKYCEENGITYGATPTIFSKSNGDCSTHRLRIQREDLKNIIKDLDQISKFSPGKQPKSNEPCPILRYILSIDADGNVYPCNSFYHKVGNIFENSISYIWQHSKELNNVKNITNEDLKECNSCGLKDYCNRCPGISLLEDGDMLGCSSLAKEIAISRYEIYKERG